MKPKNKTKEIMRQKNDSEAINARNLANAVIGLSAGNSYPMAEIWVENETLKVRTRE